MVTISAVLALIPTVLNPYHIIAAPEMGGRVDDGAPSYVRLPSILVIIGEWVPLKRRDYLSVTCADTTSLGTMPYRRCWGDRRKG